MDSASEVASTGKGRAYVPRVNHGGNYCGHSTSAPRLALVKDVVSPGKNLPGILIELQERAKSYYSKPTVLPSLRSANNSRQGRQQRSERREACLILLSAIIAHTDLVSLRVGYPSKSGFISLTLDKLVEYTGMNMRRAERAMADLKWANLITCKQPRQLKEDGTYRGLAAVKAVNKLLFTAFGLGKRLEHETKRAGTRLAKKIKKAGGTLTGWARNALVVQGISKAPKRQHGDQPKPHMPNVDNLPKGIDPEAYARARTELAVALKTADPGKTAAQVNEEADRILRERLERREGQFTA